ncbi:MAG: MMPL family transporter [Bacteroidia bacterium]|nr:MMPL family transporter [Bacteroidia bacterium]
MHHFVYRHRRVFLLVSCGLTLFFAAGLLRLRLNFSFDSFFPHNDPEYTYYEQFRTVFYEDQNYMISVALEAPGADVFDRSFLTRADSLFQALGHLPGVDSLVSATQFQVPRRRGLGVGYRPYLQYDTDSALLQSRDQLRADTSLLRLMISRDQRHVFGFIFVDPAIFDKPERDDLVWALQEALDASGTPYYITGIPQIRTRYITLMGRELKIFVTLAFLLVVTVMWLMYRSVWAVAIPTAIVCSAVIWTLGLMGYLGQEINLICAMMIPILFVVGMSDAIQITSRFLHEVRTGVDRHTALETTLRETGLSGFLTSVTTATGFASLQVSNVPPIEDFGLFAAAGVMFAWVVTLCILPSALIGLPEGVLRRLPGIENAPGWQRLMLRLHLVSMRRPVTLLIGFGCISLCALGLTYRIPTDSFLIEDIGPRDPVRRDIAFFEAQANGLRPFELVIEAAPGHTVDEVEILREIYRIETWLHTRQQFSPFFSPATVVSEANALYHFGQETYRRIPDTQAEVDQLLGFAEAGGGADVLRRVVSPDRRQARITARVGDLGANTFTRLYADLDTFIRVECAPGLFTHHLTGHAFLTERNLLYVRRNLLDGLLIDLLVIGGIMGLLFRSPRMVILSMVPNLIPLLLTAGVMGLFGIRLTASTALVFTVSFGIAVDDTIHFLNRYRLELAKGLANTAAIRITMLETGKATVLTSLILMCGFGVLVASDFGGTFNTGLFTALTVVFALLCDLFLLPVLLKFWGGK